MSEIKLELNLFDEDGELTGNTKVDSLTPDAAADIIDQATQICLLRRKGIAFKNVMDELNEALSPYGLIEPGANAAVIPNNAPTKRPSPN